VAVTLGVISYLLPCARTGLWKVSALHSLPLLILRIILGRKFSPLPIPPSPSALFIDKETETQEGLRCYTLSEWLAELGIQPRPQFRDYTFDLPIYCECNGHNSFFFFFFKKRVHWIYYGNYFMMYVSQMIMLFTLNLYCAVCQLCLNKTGEKMVRGKPFCSDSPRRYGILPQIRGNTRTL